MIADPIWPRIEAQAAALRAITGADPYQSAIGRRVELLPPTDEAPAAHIYLAGPPEVASQAGGATVAVEVRWSALIGAPPCDQIAQALQAQAEMTHALRAGCNASVERGTITEWRPGTNYTVASVVARFTVHEQ